MKALPYMSNLLTSINSLKFSKKAVDYYSDNIKLPKKSEELDSNAFGGLPGFIKHERYRCHWQPCSFAGVQ